MNVEEMLQRLDVRPSKRRGQNFLVDEAIARRLVSFSGVSAGEPVVEIGPGLGLLTGALLATQANLVVVEIEEKFCEHLAARFPSLAPERIICADARTLTGAELADRLGADRFTLVSNVPYSISSEVVLWTIEHRARIRRAALLLQEEFAERIAAAPGSRRYGSITVQRTLWAEADLGPKVSGGSFHPKANVGSRAILLHLRPEPLVPVDDLALFESVVRAAFNQRRKTLLNALSAGIPHLDRSSWSELLQAAGINPQRRAETLSVEEFARIAASIPE
ncbi:MAG: ribosomal RNA small subunit methyltransferase A [Bdellovibrionales bacterium]|nr:ribosomal RNA small subunit methyltransferase A [Bdellovibrionales bacterium]